MPRRRWPCPSRLWLLLPVMRSGVCSPGFAPHPRTHLKDNPRLRLVNPRQSRRTWRRMHHPSRMRLNRWSLLMGIRWLRLHRGRTDHRFPPRTKRFGRSSAHSSNFRMRPSSIYGRMARGVLTSPSPTTSRRPSEIWRWLSEVNAVPPPGTLLPLTCMTPCLQPLTVCGMPAAVNGKLQRLRARSSGRGDRTRRSVALWMLQTPSPRCDH